MTRTLAAGYLAVQAVAGVVLWVLIATTDTVRAGFELVAAEPGVTDAFFWADLVVVATSALGAWAVARARPWAAAVVAFTAGGVVYPTAYLVGFTRSASDGTGAVALAVMVVVSTLTCWVAVLTWRLDRGASASRG